MSYIYGIDGLLFKSSYEALQHQGKKIKPCEQSARVPGGTCNQAIKTYTGTMQGTAVGRHLVPVSQIMSSPVLTISRYQSLYTAWRLLKEANIRQLIVISGKNEAIGVLADRDILQHLNVKDGEVETSRIQPVADVLQAEIYTTDSTSDIRQVAGVMAEHHIDAVAIVDKHRATGIVTRGDILRCFASNPKLNLWA
ncbi:CBS domain-containing protein [Desulfopila inferna]|uniref:CBS domain-containing protein n=1 Tax=Desulfopila inferna TaxID=468528 RepID=UPI0019654B24|nr:CBS domain-containing protein [Desulfopila inferna]MBM9605182.1 CBS domain-containing protein [Desulfopila inferna]